MDTKMKAALIREHGDNDVVRAEQTGRPSPGAGELMVKVRASGSA